MTKILVTFAILSTAVVASAQSTAISVTGFNFDGIANGPDSSATGVQNTTTATYDSIYDYFSVGFDPADTSVGIPTGVFTSESNSNVQFEFASAAANNTLLEHTRGEGTSVGTLTIQHPTTFSTLSVMATSFNGSSTESYTLNFSSGPSTTGSFNVQDNFFGTGAAISNLGRVSRSDGTFDSIESGNPEIYEIDLSLSTADQSRTLESITFANTTGGSDPFHSVGIFGLSGTAPKPVPEPASLTLIGLGTAFLLKRKAKK